MHTLRTYCQLYTFLHLFFSHVDKQYYLCFNICLFQSTSVSTVQTVVYPGSDNSMCQLSLVDRGHIFFGFFTTVYMCILRLAACVVENLLWSHLLNFFPLFTLICFFRFAVLDFEKLHWSHLLDFPPLCTFIWLFRFAVREIEILHWSRLLFSTVCPHANPIAKCHSFLYFLMSTLADNSLNEFPKENLLKPCTLCAYQGPANSMGKLHSFLQLIILQHGSRFPTHQRFKSTWIRRFQPSLFFLQNGIQVQLCLTQHARQRQTLFIATQRQTLSAVDQWQTLLFDT